MEIENTKDWINAEMKIIQKFEIIILRKRITNNIDQINVSTKCIQEVAQSVGSRMRLRLMK